MLTKSLSAFQNLNLSDIFSQRDLKAKSKNQHEILKLFKMIGKVECQKILLFHERDI